MFTVISPNTIFHTASIYEAETIMGREYNLKLADILAECPIANPVRKKTNKNAYIVWKGVHYQWKIKEKKENIA